MQLRPDGVAQLNAAQGYPAHAWQVGEVRMAASSRHGGERHLDGDEIVYLISGSAGVSIDRNDDTSEVVDLQPGEALVVPKGVWHRVLIDEPSRLIFVGTGRTDVRPASEVV